MDEGRWSWFDALTSHRGRPSSARASVLAAALAAISAFAPVPRAEAQTGVSDDRVSVPDGPGSIEGLGDNATIAPNMGAMTYRVDFEVPRGFPGVTPSLGLVYSSSYGNGLAGIGWYLPIPTIERLTLRGLPEYDADDEFAADGSEQLVRISSAGGDATYRARFEGGFVRYTWHDAGEAGYWVAEYPDGRVGYFGADSSGAIVSDARLSGEGGETFRYHLVEVVDVYGHRMRLEYSREGGVPYCTSVAYVFDSSDAPRHLVELGYEARPDPVSDAKPGFEERVALRLAEVRVAVNGALIRTYALSYEDEDDAGGLSRLVSVERFGRDGGRHPVAFTFGYSRALGGVCTAGACGAPFVVDMGTLPHGGSIQAGDATLVDINGDALPDLVDTSQPGAHRFVINRLDDNGGSYFDPVVVTSAVGDRSGFRVSQPTVQVLDLDGDGFSDIINTFAGGSALCNHGTGDWSTAGCVLDDDLGLELLADEAGDADPRYTRFLDVDHDRRIDVVRTGTSDTITVRRNHGAGFEALAGAEPIGAAFDDVRLLLADMNGDGLLDPVQILDAGSPQYRLNLGFARWGDWTTIAAPDVDLSERDFLALEDLDDDGRDDLVLVTPGSGVRYALNRNGSEFGAMVTLGPEDVPGLPLRGVATSVLFADMNGNGSRDVVWIETSGQVRYLELFPIPPNLLHRIENGIGSIQEIHYDTAVAQRESDDVAWSHPLAHPMIVVERTDSWVTLTGGEDGAGLHDVTHYRYRDGFYDGAEKAFRGFARVETTSPRDSEEDTQEPGRTVLEYDVGDEDPYRYGRELRTETFSGDGAEERALEEWRREYEDCDVAGVPQSGILFDVRFVCETSRTVIRKEGAPAAEWATIRSETERDGYGNVVLESSLGVVHMGSPEAPIACGACDRDPDAFGAACGEACLGDEAYVSTAYVAPGTDTGGRYIVGKPHTVRRFGREGGASSEETIYYDGPAYVGLVKGKLTLGNATRVTARVNEGSSATLDVARSAYDADGNVIGTIDPNGTVADTTTHRRTYQYDVTGLRPIRTDVHLRSPEDVPYVLRREYSYDPAFDQVSEATAWMVVEGGESLSARNATRYRYDEFGRRIAILLPGDADDAPTTELVWELMDPASRIRLRMRSAAGTSPDVESVRCADGAGREFQSRTRIGGDVYQVSGFAEKNARGVPLRVYEPYVDAGPSCAVTAPEGVLHETVRFDAAFREIARTLPDADLYGSPSTTASRFRPLAAERFDEDDSDESGPHAATPTITHLDGLGRVVAVERRLTSDGQGALTRIEYDDLGRVRSLFDDHGNEKQQRHDLRGRLLEIDDPSSGVTTFSYDAADNLLSRTDARGVTTWMSYDGASRPSAQWDGADREGTEVRLRYDYGGACAPSDCSHAAGQRIETSYPVPSFVRERIGGPAMGVDHFGFDPRGRAVFESRAVGGFAYRTRTERDRIGRARAVVHPDGQRVEVDYDGASRPVAIGGVADAIAYDARGLLSSISYANGAEDAWTYDARRRPRTLVTRDAAGNALQDVTYERGRVGGIRELADAAEAPPGWDPLQANFTQDAWYRLTSAEMPAGAASETRFFAYDTIDNLISTTSSLGDSSVWHLGELEYDTDRPNAVTRVGDRTYEYDDAGHVLRYDGLELAWDHLDRLVGATRDGEPLAQMAYASGTSRVATLEGESLTLHVSSDFEVRDGVSVLYARLGRRRLARVASDALSASVLGDVAPVGAADEVITAGDAWIAHAGRAGIHSANVEGTAASETLLRAAARRLLVEADRGAVTLHADHLESLTFATDAEGVERGRRRFRLPAGDDRETGFVDVYGFSGQEEIACLGWIRFEHRWLDPVALRWTQPDPLFEQASPNAGDVRGQATDRYAYVANDFLDAIDPTGLDLEDLLYTVGTYADLRAMVTNEPNPTHLEVQVDHQPSHASNVARREAELGRPLTPQEIADVRNEGTAVIVTADWHRAQSRTYGGRNNRAKINQDAAHPVRAAIADGVRMVTHATPGHGLWAVVASVRVVTRAAMGH